MDDSIKKLAEAIDEKGFKVKFGLEQQGHLELIESKFKNYPDFRYSHQIWQDIGKEIGWDALTAALWYFQFHASPSSAVVGAKEKATELAYLLNVPEDYLHKAVPLILAYAQSSNATKLPSITEEGILKEAFIAGYEFRTLKKDGGQGIDFDKWLLSHLKSGLKEREGWISVDTPPEDDKLVLGKGVKGTYYLVAYNKLGPYLECDDDDCKREHDSDEMCRSGKPGFYEECEQTGHHYDYIVFKRDIIEWQPLAPNTNN